jgi:hypothetical protein
MPPRIARLPQDSRGYPVPSFVEWINGKPDFRVMQPAHFIRCVKQKRCWVCGDVLGQYQTFVVGPMCIINRTSSEPPSHRECGRYSARVCPFLAIPAMRRIEAHMPAHTTMAGMGIARNPDVTCLWTVHDYRIFRTQANPSVGTGEGILFQMGEPVEVEWWTQGRKATREEVEASIASGLPILQEIARQHDGADGLAELSKYHQRALQHLPVGASP